MKLIKGEFEEKLSLLFAPAIKAGFPSPADDYLSDSLDFNKDLIKYPEATFYGREDFDELIIEVRGSRVWVHFAVRSKGNRRKILFDIK